MVRHSLSLASGYSYCTFIVDNKDLRKIGNKTRRKSLVARKEIVTDEKHTQIEKKKRLAGHLLREKKEGRVEIKKEEVLKEKKWISK